MKTKRLLFLCALLFVFAVPVPARAAQASRSLSAGRAYTFANSDARTVAYVSVAGSARYEYVSRDAYGAVVDFGVASGRFPVRGGGTTMVSLYSASSASVSYDGAKISVRDASGSALRRVTVAAGANVRIANTRDEVLSVAVDNTGRTEYAQYDCAVRDRFGAAAFFMDACRYTSLTIPVAGNAVFTANTGGLTLMFPAAWSDNELTVREENRPALTETMLRFGQAYGITNTGNADRAISAASGQAFAYDFIRADEWGAITDYAHDAREGKITVGAGETLYITPLDRSQGAVEAEGVRLVYPNDETGGLRVTEAQMSLTSYAVAPGDTLTLVNGGVSPFTFHADPSEPAPLLDYTYAGGSYNEQRSVTEEPFTEMTLGAGYTWVFTARKAALTLWLPASWLDEGLSVNGAAQPALTGYTLAAGRTLVITNADPDRTYEIQLQSAQAVVGLSYDYAVEDAHGATYNADYRENTLTLPPSGTLTLTAGASGALTVKLPSASVVTTRETQTPALTKHTIAPGASVRAEATGTRGFELTPQKAAGTADMGLDFTMTDDENRITDFGRVESGIALALEQGASALFTNTGTNPAVLVFPGAWLNEGLRVEKSEQQALFRQTLRENQTLDITNADKRYDRVVRVEVERNGLDRFDFVSQNDKLVVEYGVGGIGFVTLYAGGKISLMPQKGVTLTLCYPAIWKDSVVKVTTAATAPLYRRTLKPGEKMTFTNRSKTTYAIQNSSETTAARYYLREGTQTGRIAGEQTVTGIIDIGAQSTFTVIAATGADLDIWMPQAWAKQLVR